MNLIYFHIKCKSYVNTAIWIAFDSFVNTAYLTIGL